MKGNEAVIEVYKKKVEQMCDMQFELTDSHELN